MNTMGGIVENEDLLSASLPMKFKIEGGQQFKILSKLYQLKTHYTDPRIIDLRGKSPTTIAYMGDDSDAIKMGLKVKQDYYYLVETTGEKGTEVVVQLLPAGVVYGINDCINNLKKVKKTADADKRKYSWQVVKIEPKTKDDYVSYTAKAVSEITPISDSELQTNTESLINTMSGYVDRITQKYHEYINMGYQQHVEEPERDPIPDEINIDEIPF